MKAFGQLLLWLGFLGAATTTVLNLEVRESPWSTIPWLYYAMAMAVGIVGVVLLRIAASEFAQDTSRVQAEFDTLTTSLDTLLQNVGELRSKVARAGSQEITAFIDEKCIEPFSDFADSRNALIQQFGLTAFADVMTQFASGERFVNRAWSAAADGYIDESSASLERAERHLQLAQQQMTELATASDDPTIGK